MNKPANAAVREQRRGSTALDIERLNVMKALTAAEYSRRQFVLNFAASKDTQLLVPGQKADVIKEAEEWAASYLSQNGFGPVSNDFFKYTVDARLWTTLVGAEPDFPFAFMRRAFDDSAASSASTPGDATPRPASCIFPGSYEIGANQLDRTSTYESAQPELPPSRQLSRAGQRDRERAQSIASQTQPSTPAVPQRSRAKKKKTGESDDKRRSLSTYGFEDLKMTKKLNQDKFPMLVRLGRSFSRRMSG